MQVLCAVGSLTWCPRCLAGGPPPVKDLRFLAVQDIADPQSEAGGSTLNIS